MMSVENWFETAKQIERHFFELRAWEFHGIDYAFEPDEMEAIREYLMKRHPGYFFDLEMPRYFHRYYTLSIMSHIPEKCWVGV